MPTSSITVTNHGYTIFDGDSSPATGDGSDLGSTTLGGVALTQTYTVTNQSGGTLNFWGLTLPEGYTLVEGLSGSLGNRASDTFTIQLPSSTWGTYSGQIEFESSDSQIPTYNFQITGLVARPGIDQSQQTVTDFAPTDVARIENLLADSKWGAALGTGTTLTYSFSGTSSVFSYTHNDGDWNAHDPVLNLTPAQQQAARAAMEAMSAVCNIQFVEVADTATQAGDIRWTSTGSSNQSTADAVLPSDGDASSGDIWFANGTYASFGLGGYEYQSFIHELGHAVGLIHPHEGLPASVYGEDQLKYTVMSYRAYLGAPLTGYTTDVYPSSYMLNDILALQYLYGANTSYHSGNDTYRWAADASIAECLWDGGGVDTIDASNQSAGCTLNLTAGSFSSIGMAFDNGDPLVWSVRDYLSIAYNVVIENANGSAYADTLTGNSAANLLKGNAGNDTLNGDAGHDTLDGGSGNDRMLGGDGSDTYYVNSSADQVVETNTASTGGTDLVVSSITRYTLATAIENGRINTTNAANLTGNSGNNVLYAGAGNNVLNGGSGTDTAHYGYASAAVTVNLSTTTAQATGGSGSDTLTAIENLMGSKYGDRLTGNIAANRLNGDAGNDTLSSGSGNDTLIGGAGKDSLSGGAGNDLFDFNALSELGLGSTARDVITDFMAGQDKIDLSTIDANSALAGDQAFTFVSSFTATAGQVRYSGGIVYLNTDADTAAEYEIQLTGSVPVSLSAVSFVL